MRLICTPAQYCTIHSHCLYIHTPPPGYSCQPVCTFSPWKCSSSRCSYSCSPSDRESMRLRPSVLPSPMKRCEMSVKGNSGKSSAGSCSFSIRIIHAMLPVGRRMCTSAHCVHQQLHCWLNTPACWLDVFAGKPAPHTVNILSMSLSCYHTHRKLLYCGNFCFPLVARIIRRKTQVYVKGPDASAKVVAKNQAAQTTKIDWGSIKGITAVTCVSHQPDSCYTVPTSQPNVYLAITYLTFCSHSNMCIHSLLSHKPHVIMLEYVTHLCLISHT